MPVPLLLVEDVLSVRDSICRALKSDQVQVAACASTVQEATSVVRSSTAFDVALVDLHLPDGSGLEVIREIARLRPHVAALALTVFDDEHTVRTAVLAGAQGYLLKDCEAHQLTAAVCDAAAGGAPLSPAIARWILEEYRKDRGQPASGAPTVASLGLTPRELDLVRLLCQGHSYASAAAQLELSLGTVQGYVKSVYSKLRVSSKIELSNRMREHGLV